MKIEAGQVYLLGSNLVLNEELVINGKFRFDPNKSAKLTIASGKNLINNAFEGIEMRPANAGIIHEIEMSGINESLVVGGAVDGTEVKSTDPGIWNMGLGTMNVQGAYRKRFTNATGSVLIGAKSVTVKDATGWRVGDEIVIATTTDIPPAHGEGVTWNEGTKTYSDPFLERHERRIITSVSGNTVSFTDPLRFNHFEYKTTPNKLAPNGRHYTAYIANLTSNVKIHGTKTGKSHIFNCAHTKNADGSTKHNIQKSFIDQAEIYLMGPRKYQGARYGIPQIITGRYAMHFHHGGDGTIGTMVSNCSFHDNDTRICVPHMANGVTFKGNALAFNMGESFWWDIGEVTNDATYDSNYVVGNRWDKTLAGTIGILFGIGSNNKAINNWFTHSHVGDENGSGALQWSTNNESVWVVIGNGGNSNNCLDWTWQNSGRPHDIEEQQAYCNTFGLSHGAYANPYIYTENEYYNSPVHVKAAASIAMGASFERCVFDGMNIADWTVNKQTSAAGDRFGNQFRECEFKNARVAVRMDNFRANSEFSVQVHVELINCLFSGIQKKVEFWMSDNNPAYQPLDVQVKIQNGNTAESHRKGGVTSIPKFAPDKFGTGDGLKGEYYKGMNFEQKIFTRLDSMIRHDMWRVDNTLVDGKPIYPEGVHYKLNSGPFSVRWVGEHEPWASGAWQYKIMGASGYRLWINNQLIINSPGNKGDNAEFALSSIINLEAFKKYPIKIECYEPGDEKKGIILYWKHASLIDFEDVPKCQLYSGATTPAPPPIPPTPPDMPDLTTLVPPEYIAMYKDLRDHGIDTDAEAIKHWNENGKKEGRFPNYAARDAGQPPVVKKLVKTITIKVYDDLSTEIS